MQASARIAVSKRAGLILDYAHPFSSFRTKANGFEDPIGIGYEIETGGHVFQIHLSNSTGLTERSFIAETSGRWSKGDIHFGFNVSRVFSVKKPKQTKI